MCVEKTIILNDDTLKFDCLFGPSFDFQLFFFVFVLFFVFDKKKRKKKEDGLFAVRRLVHAKLQNIIQKFFYRPDLSECVSFRFTFRSSLKHILPSLTNMYVSLFSCICMHKRPRLYLCACECVCFLVERTFPFNQMNTTYNISLFFFSRLSSILMCLPSQKILRKQLQFGSLNIILHTCAWHCAIVSMSIEFVAMISYCVFRNSGVCVCVWICNDSSTTCWMIYR